MKLETTNERLNDELDFDDDEDTQKDLYLTFLLEEQSYGMEIRYVTEIVGMQDITEVPDVPHFIKGVINLRGNVIPIVDVRLRFSMDPRDYDERTCIIVTTMGDVTVGLVVDQVSEVISIKEEMISPPPQVNENGTNADYIKGLGRLEEAVSILLDIQELLGEGACL